MKTFADWLTYYNNLDVEPFLGALESMQGFYTRLGIDIFKDAVSLPGFQWKMCCWAHWTTETPRSCMPQARRPTKCSKEWSSGDRAWSFVESMRQAKLESVHTNSHAQPTKSKASVCKFSEKCLTPQPILWRSTVQPLWNGWPHRRRSKRICMFFWESANTTPEIHKISENQTRKGVGKIWSLSFEALWDPNFCGARPFWWWGRTSKGANQVDWYFGKTCRSNSSTSPWDPDCRNCRGVRRGKGEKIHKMAGF